MGLNCFSTPDTKQSCRQENWDVSADQTLTQIKIVGRWKIKFGLFYRMKQTSLSVLSWCMWYCSLYYVFEGERDSFLATMCFSPRPAESCVDWRNPLRISEDSSNALISALSTLELQRWWHTFCYPLAIHYQSCIDLLQQSCLLAVKQECLTWFFTLEGYFSHDLYGNSFCSLSFIFFFIKNLLEP